MGYGSFNTKQRHRLCRSLAVVPMSHLRQVSEIWQLLHTNNIEPGNCASSCAQTVREYTVTVRANVKTRRDNEPRCDYRSCHTYNLQRLLPRIGHHDDLKDTREIYDY